ncbi:receptor-like protein EIX1 [Cynara cardunculus var. scolymus]|uniref:receptor-like protein EIX1 n=1 Tax=Cynara cardunculus var. scolymus TaxID=59895 RepID=UPI000D62E633|nr:receptor-like protein EIX1 [Cynara cardunculus var. scolymus]
MTRLTYLNLGSNSFNGTIPKSIGSLIELRYLDLSYNFLIGNIPPEIGNLTNLRNLSLGRGAYYAIGTMVENLDWLSNLSHLQHLDMYGVSLAKANRWVDVILSLPKLSYLSLSRCDLSEVIYPYSSFVNSSSSSIGSLQLTQNSLNSSMYRWLFALTSNRLVSLDLSYNMLDGVPKYHGNLCSLTSLNLHGNSAVVNFPDFLNNLSGCTSVTLQELYASGNQFTGSLSDEIQKFSSLKRLKLPYNQLNGTISEKVWELHKLEYLDISSNSLRGVTSENIGNSKLWHLDLSNNPLEVIPSQGHVLNISYVEYMDLRNCKLGPVFPKWIQAHKNLTTLNIANTRISDTIPAEFWKTWPSRLTYLNLSSNNISGEVSDLSSNFGLYSEIDLSSNNLHGPIQNVPPTLILLNLSKNIFYGGISFLCQVVDGFLSFLDLSQNFLTGQLPDCLSHFKELEVLNLGHNNLSGKIPASIGHLVQLMVLHLYNNSLSGELPSALKNCTKLN